MMIKSKISVSDALKKLELGESLNNYSIDWDRIKVESLDVLKLAKGGVVVPEEAIYYDDDDIEFDEEFEGDWEKIENDPIDELRMKTEVEIILNKDMKQWIDSRNIKLEELIENLLNNFYRTQKMVSKD